MDNLYASFQKCIEEEDISQLEAFQDKNFWKDLADEERKQLAFLFLKRAEFSLESGESLEASFFVSLAIAEKIGAPHPEILCRIAFFLFKYGLFQQKGIFLLQALDKLMLCEETDPFFLENNAHWFHLWGNVLTALGKILYDHSFIEEALEKYDLAEKSLTVQHSLIQEICWDRAEAWALLFSHSEEPSDLKRSIESYQRALNEGTSSPQLRSDFATVLTDYGKLTGNPELLEEAISLFCGAIADSYDQEKEASAIYKKAWIGYALAAKSRFLVTHRNSHLEAANTIFREAILNAADYADLWLHWGELFLQSGLLSNHLGDIETGLEKLTSSKVKDCNPLRISALLGTGLVTLGHLLDDLKLIRDGKEKILAALEIAPEHPGLNHAAGLADLFLGLYFSDDRFLKISFAIFDKNLELEPYKIENWHGLYQTCVTLGVMKKDASFLRKAIEALSRLIEMRPFSALLLNEKGIALLKLRQLDEDEEQQQETIEEAISIFKKAYQLNEDEEILFNLACAFDLLAECTGNEEDYEEAIEILVKLYEKNPASHICYHLAIILSHHGELAAHVESLNQAVDLFESIVSVQRENDDFWCEYGYTLLNLSELVFDTIHPEKGEHLRREAEKKLLKAVKLGNALACYHLACLYSLSGLHQASLQFLQRAETRGSLPAIEDLEQDDWLTEVRKTEAFKEFLTRQKTLLKNSDTE